MMSLDLGKSSRYLYRVLAHFFSVNFVKSRPSNTISPFLMRPGGFGINPINALEVTDFPEPDSPTIANVSPFSNQK